MQLLARFESRFGLTRGDVTVTLFLAASALVGFFYVTFFDTRPELVQRDLSRLFAHRDSVLAARQVRTAAALDTALAETAVAPPWVPLGAIEKAGDSADAARGASRGGKGGKQPPAKPIDLNTASLADLMRLPGVGEKTAEAIVERRRESRFRSIEDLMEVKGIGPKKLEKIRPFVMVR